jgi:phenylalanyl-tRNA synthetase beta chain
MKVSVPWLQTYFDTKLPGAAGIADAFTFHAFEIEAVEGEMLDIKVLPNRAADCMSVRGIAKELSAILETPLKEDPLRAPLPELPKTDALEVAVDESYVLRHMGALVSGVTVGPSPSWLKERLESVGQRSINNVVDATNYVMLSLGQPLHAFDAGKIAKSGDTLKIDIRRAKDGEKITILSGEEYALTDKMFVIADAVSGQALDIAGLKGGAASGITEETSELFISVGNYDGTIIRKMAQKLKLFTDASQRYQNRPSPELCAYGMHAVLALIKEMAGGEFRGVVDAYPHAPETKTVSASAERISKHLGASYSDEDVAGVLKRLDLPYKKDGALFVVTAPFERTDLVIPEDLAEEVGRILGYDRLPLAELPETAEAPDQRRFRGIERMKDQLVERGFTEVSTQSFVKKGDVILANPLDKTRPALRKSLEETLTDALTKAKLYAPLVLPPNQKPKLFEAGTVFPKEGEHVELRMTEVAWEGVPTHDNLTLAKLEEYGKEYEPARYALGPYTPFSAYPFVLRDIALWVSGAEADAVRDEITAAAGELLHRMDLFDTFEKDGRTSFAFRLVFQSDERTLSDEDVNGIMEKINAAIAAKGWQVR